MTELCRIMNENGSDKGSGWHNYTILYEGIFSKKRLDKLNIFELGLGTNNIEISSSLKWYAGSTYTSTTTNSSNQFYSGNLINLRKIFTAELFLFFP